MLSKNKSSSFIPFLISIYIYLISMAFAFIDSKFQYRWLTLFLWIISITYIPIIGTLKKIRSKPKINISKNDKLAILIILLTGLILNFSLLKEYPFVSIYDQVRDGGLNAAQIADGTIKNIFSYGRYASHGLIIPTITSFFYHVFGNSVLTFRFPAALLTTLSALIIYISLKKNLGKTSAFFASIVFLTLPLVLYYARTEVVVTFSIFLFALIFLYMSKFIKKRGNELYVIGGTLLGFSAGFHTSVRTMSILVLGIIFLITLLDFYKDRRIKKPIISLILLSIFFFVGFGPRLIFTTPDIFFQTRSIVSQNQKALNQPNNYPLTIINNYKKSLLVYVSEPTLSTHYADFKPVLSPIAAIFFIIGILFAFIKNNTLMKISVFFALIIPLTNSAITDTINSDNRFGPLFVIASILTGFGISSFSNLIKKRNLKYIFLAAVFIIFIWQGMTFFIKESASKQYSEIDYLSMHTITAIQKDSEFTKLNRICIYANSTFYNYAKLYHVQEQFEYFVPNKYIYVAQVNSIPSNELYISKNCNGIKRENYKKIILCAKNEKFLCPKQPLFLYKEMGNNFSALKFNDQFFIINPTPAFIP